MPQATRNALIGHLGVDEHLVLTASRVALSEWTQLAAVARPDLKNAALAATTPWRREASGAETSSASASATCWCTIPSSRLTRWKRS